MTRAETVTLFNDICVLAAATLIGGAEDFVGRPSVPWRRARDPAPWGYQNSTK
jgi:hypothetical protein